MYTVCTHVSHCEKATDQTAFDPREVYTALYKEVCAANIGDVTLRNAQDEPVTFMRTAIVELVECEFVTRARLICSKGPDRVHVLDRFREWTTKIKTYRTCLACLQRAPEYKLSCNHMICEDCCIDLGRRADSDPDLFCFTHCPLCTLSCNIRIRIRPATAGLRVLSIDGGGVRAVVPIQFLRALEHALGLDMPIQEHFDLSFGTSSGKENCRPLCRYADHCIRIYGEYGPLRARSVAR
jgi:hypothetical protein